MRPLAVAVLVAVFLCACVAQEPFLCRSSAQCLAAGGESGVCEPTGFCSFEDVSCASGRRYGEHAGNLSDTCTGATTAPDPDDPDPIPLTCESCGVNEICAGEACTCIAEVKAGSDHTCARKADGTVWCWGFNGQGALGTGALDDADVPVAAAVINAVEIAGGEYFSCARLVDGTVSCWGSGEALGGAGGDSAVPVPVAGVTDAVELGLGEYHACARKTNGHVWCWGRNDEGQVGEDDAAMTAHRVKHLPAAIDLSVGGHHACVLDASGAVWCWGKNDYGQLGDGTDDDRAKPVEIAAFAGAIEVAAGGEHTCVRKGDDSVWCVGANPHGQLGAPGGDRSTPVQVNGLPGDPIAQLAAGEWNSCVRLTDGRVLCWGRNDAGQLGLGATGNAVARASDPVVELPPAIDLVVGERHLCARAVDGRAYCWGAGELGQLGAGAVDDAGAPTPREVMLACP